MSLERNGGAGRSAARMSARRRRGRSRAPGAASRARSTSRRRRDRRRGRAPARPTKRLAGPQSRRCRHPAMWIARAPMMIGCQQQAEQRESAPVGLMRGAGSRRHRSEPRARRASDGAGRRGRGAGGLGRRDAPARPRRRRRTRARARRDRGRCPGRGPRVVGGDGVGAPGDVGEQAGHAAALQAEEVVAAVVAGAEDAPDRPARAGAGPPRRAGASAGSGRRS